MQNEGRMNEEWWRMMKNDEEWWRMMKKDEEGWMKKDEGWMMKDDDFKLLRGFDDGQTDSPTDICDFRAAFATGK